MWKHTLLHHVCVGIFPHMVTCAHTLMLNVCATPSQPAKLHLRCSARSHPPAGSSPRVKLKPDPVQLLLECCVILRWKVLLNQVFMGNLKIRRTYYKMLRSSRDESASWSANHLDQDQNISTFSGPQRINPNNLVIPWLSLSYSPLVGETGTHLHRQWM